MSLRVLGVIPARGGSKGIPRKNITPLLGRPLLGYTADAALASRRITRALLSTDDPEIAEVGRQCGLDVPFLRPIDLAQDHTPTLPVVKHAVEWVEQEGDGYDAICLLQPTSPLRRTSDIDSAIEMLERSDADSVVSVSPIPHRYNPHWAYVEQQDGALRLSTGEEEPIPRRQDLPRAFYRDGSIYVVRRDVLMQRNSLYGTKVLGHVVDESRSVNIDDSADLERAVALAAGR